MIFENKPGEMIDILVENDTFKPTAYTKVRSCTHNGFMVGGSEHIEDLPQKIREMKLEKLGL